ncbi:MAG: aldolase/citrate lyase family protein [Atopobiaceae bacterium]|jgi:2-keto-3-deoxy-L-rhamnonate aldolase RhmA|nr:aldolase/citrate lyase family protein [Atopobiaceae bacterium]MCI2172672.1 aldolase/citrate lyase family protein [Atopobiaceae bacterium]MCI2206979.1 aldolase/citrate lyase family protein [Atopobiaceae bacterium]
MPVPDLKHQAVGRAQGGLLVQVCDTPAIMLMARDADLDFVFFDCEHGVIPYDHLHDLMLMGNEMGIPSLVRAGQLARVDVSRILDFGAAGVMVPMMETAEQAELLVAWSKYPPLGRRSYSGGGSTAYGPSGGHSTNMAAANDLVMAIAQIETVEGCANAEAICSVEGIDAVIVGPCDLAISLGTPDDVDTEREAELIDQVAKAAHAHGCLFGIIGGNAMLARHADEVDLMVSAIDTHLLRGALATSEADYDSIRADAR